MLIAFLLAKQLLLISGKIIPEIEQKFQFFLDYEF